MIATNRRLFWLFFHSDLDVHPRCWHGLDCGYRCRAFHHDGSATFPKKALSG